MGFKRIIAPMLLGVASLSATMPAFGASSGDQLYLVPPSQTATVQFASPYPATQDPLDQAISNFGKVLGQASLADQQKIKDFCATGAPANATLQERYAWAASCRYSRR
jgi:hypothetical protein